MQSESSLACPIPERNVVTLPAAPAQLRTDYRQQVAGSRRQDGRQLSLF